MRFVILLLWVAAAVASVCQPPVAKRAFVTILTDIQDCLLKVRVLKKSLRRSGSHADAVVIVPDFVLDKETERVLTEDGFRIHTVGKGVLKGVKHSDLREVLPLWAFELFQYQRVVYLDPFSLVIDNMDVTFRCPGYCASQDSKYGPVVLQPQKDTYAYLRQLLQTGKRDLLLELQWFYNLATCPPFTDYDNTDNVPTCQASDYKSSSLSTCHRLPVSQGVPSSYFSSSSVMHPLVCPQCGYDQPRLIIYPDAAQEPPYEAFLFTEKAIRWRWHHVRSSIPVTQSEVLSALMAFCPPLVAILIILWSHRKGSLRSAANNTDMLSLDDITNRRIVEMSSGHSLYSFRFLVQALSVLAATSAWYRVSRLLGVTMTSFWWEPTTASSVVFVWMIMALLMGLQIIDLVYVSKKTGLRRLCLQVGISIGLFLLLRHLLPIQQQHFPAFMLLLAALLCRWCYWDPYDLPAREKSLSRSPSLAESLGATSSPPSPATTQTQQASSGGHLVQKEDISVLLVISLCYYLATGIALFLPLPDALKTIVIRLIAFFHATCIISLFICVVYGQAAWIAIPAGRSDLVSYVCLYNPCRGSVKESIDTKCTVLWRYTWTVLELLKHPCMLIFLFVVSALLFVFYVLFLERIPTMPSTHPYFCLQQHGMYINPGGSISTMCGASQAMSLHDTGAWSETFSQHYVCFQTAAPTRTMFQSPEMETDLSTFIQNTFMTDYDSFSSGRNDTRIRQGKAKVDKAKTTKYLSMRRGTLSSCSPETQFVFITTEPNQLADNKGYCIYSPRQGKFLSSGKEPSDVCGNDERWHVEATHAFTDMWYRVQIITSPLRYRFAYSSPLVTAVLLVGAVLLMRIRQVGHFEGVSLFIMINLCFVCVV